AAWRITGQLEAVVAAEVVKALSGDELLRRGGSQQEVLVGELAEDPAAFRPCPGGDRIRLGSGRSVEQQRSVAVDSDAHGAPPVRFQDHETQVADGDLRRQGERRRHQLATRRAWLALASLTRRSATGVVCSK